MYLWPWVCFLLSRCRYGQLFVNFCIQRAFTLRLYPLPYWWPTPSVVHPPMVSIMSAGHSTALNRSPRLCRNEWMTHPSGTRGFNHLFNAALAELALHLVSLQYFGKANWSFYFTTCFAAQSIVPTSGIFRELEFVFSTCQGYSIRLIWGVSVLRLISDVCKPQASDKRIPVSLIKAINNRGSSSKFRHVDCNWVKRSFGMGNLSFLLPSSWMKLPLKMFSMARPCSRIARLTMALTDEKTRSTEDEDSPLSNRLSLKWLASNGFTANRLSWPKYSSR